MPDTGVVSNEDDLRKFFDNYIMQPVLTKAVPSSEDQQGDRQDYRYACLITLITRPYAAHTFRVATHYSVSVQDQAHSSGRSSHCCFAGVESQRISMSMALSHDVAAFVLWLTNWSKLVSS